MLVLLVEMGGTEFTELGVPGEDVEHCEQDLVSDGHRGAFGAQAGLEPIVLLLVVGAFDLGGARRRAKQRRFEIKVALARARLARPAGALVIAGAHPGPGSEPAGVAEHRHVDADLGEDLRGPDLVDAGNALEKLDLPAIRPHPLGHPTLQLGQIALDLVEPAQVQTQQKAVMLAHPPLERLDQRLQLGAQPALGQLGHRLRRHVPSASARSMAVPDTPKTSVATLDSLMLALSSSLTRLEQ